MKYEYKVLGEHEVGHSDSDLQSTLNQLGQQGWELCANDGSNYIFKRPVITPRGVCGIPKSQAK